MKGEEDSGALFESAVHSPSRPLYFWFAIILGVNIASLFWLSVRADSPAYVRTVLDLLLHGAAGGVVVYVAFRALLRYPYYFSDLMTIVLVLSGGMKMTVDFVNSLAALGVIGSGFNSAERFGEIFQVCLFSGSVLLAGAALGLRHCTLLKIKGGVRRGISIVAGMFALPAAAGVAGFPVLIIRELVIKNGTTSDAFVFIVQWFLATGISALNAAYFFRSITLNAEIEAKENMP